MDKSFSFLILLLEKSAYNKLAGEEKSINFVKLLWLAFKVKRWRIESKGLSVIREFFDISICCKCLNLSIPKIEVRFLFTKVNDKYENWPVVHGPMLPKP